MVFLEVLFAIFVWRLLSSLEPVDYDRIKEIVKKEVRLSKQGSKNGK